MSISKKEGAMLCENSHGVIFLADLQDLRIEAKSWLIFLVD